MASPPYNQQFTPSAISPPYPSSASLPLKRRQSDGPTSGPAIKRRKASMLSTTSASSLHPLRQTSFPPEALNARYSRSPSGDNMSMRSGSAVGVTGKNKRKRKSAKGAKGDDDESIVGLGKKAKAEGKAKRRASRDQTAEDDDEGADGGDMAVETAVRTLEEKQKEIEHRAMLAGALDEEQFSRFEAWRSSKLSDSVVRRIVNQTLSQSAPASVILAVKSVAKIFAGEIIDGARKVQTEWFDTSGESQTTGLPSPPAEGAEGKPKEKEKRRGPLLPDHLRESYRRYKAEGDGGLAGQLGLWQVQASSGVERFGVKIGGKRLLK